MKQDNSLAKIMKSLRRQKGITQSDIAKALSVSRQAVAHWECGLSCPSGANVEKLAIYFSVTPEFLLGGKEVDGFTNVQRTLLSHMRRLESKAGQTDRADELCLIANAMRAITETLIDIRKLKGGLIEDDAGELEADESEDADAPTP